MSTDNQDYEFHIDVSKIEHLTIERYPNGISARIRTKTSTETINNAQARKVIKEYKSYVRRNRLFQGFLTASFIGLILAFACNQLLQIKKAQLTLDQYEHCK